MRDAPNQRRLLDFQQHVPTVVEAAELYPNLKATAKQQPAKQVQPVGEHEVHHNVPHGQPTAETYKQQHGMALENQGQELQQQAQKQEDEQHQLEQSMMTAGVLPSPPAQAQPMGPKAQAPAASTSPASNDIAQKTAAELRAACDVLKGRPRSTAEDPEGFMTSFFKSSRLHFIGSWKARIEALMLANEGSGPSPSPATGTAATGASGAGLFAALGKGAKVGAAKGLGSRTIIHLDMDAFFATVAAVERAEFKGVLLLGQLKGF
jgi:DNA repair protein REV1